MSGQLLLDMDGVLADFVAGFCATHGIENPYNDPANHGNPSVTKISGLPPHIAYGPMEHDWWANLPPLPWAFELVSLLEERFGDSICILSKPTWNVGCMGGKFEWICKHFSQFKERFLFGAAKFFAAGPGKVLLDDHEDNCKKFREAGGEAILFPGLWNRLYSVDDHITYVRKELEKC